MTAVADQC